MSLINDVLRDLEKRERTAPTVLQTAFGPAVNYPPARVTRVWVTLAVLLLGGVLVFWWLPPASGPIIATASELPAVPPPAPEFVNPLPSAPAINARQSEPQPEPRPEPQPELRVAVQPDVPSVQEAEARSELQPEIAAPPQAKVVQPFVARTATVTPSNPTPQAATPRITPMATPNASSSIHIRRHNTQPESSAPPSTNLASLKQVEQDLGRGRLQSAEQQLDALLQTQPAHSDARLLLARLYLHQHRSQEALLLLQANTSAARQPDFDLLLAASLRETGQHTQAAELYQRLTRQHPGSLQALLGLALSQEAAGEWQAATGNYRLLLDSADPRTVQLANQRLLVLQQRALGARIADSPTLPSTRERTSHP